VSAVDVIELRRVYKGRDKRPDVVALDGLSMQLEEGEVGGLLGPNGAGKTTLVKILSTVLLPTSGRAVVLGHDVVSDTRAVRRLIGIVFGGDRGLYGLLSARQNLAYWAALYDVPEAITGRRIEELLERVGLAGRADDRVEMYSRGMKQRLHLARGLIADARVLLLDEPTTGMDPLAARDFRQLIGELKSERRTILLCTHDMVEAQTVCDRVALIDHGRLLAVETPNALRRLVSRYERVEFSGGSTDLVSRVRGLPGVTSVNPLVDGGFRAEVSGEAAVQRVLAELVGAGVTIVSTTPPTLEEVYIRIVGDRGLTV
jgi:ABC-2 type transport system ATP-binding protein